MYRDPICGMQVQPGSAAGQSQYKGRTYYFCSAGCKKTFDANPQKHAESSKQPQAAHNHGCCS